MSFPAHGVPAPRPVGGGGGDGVSVAISVAHARTRPAVSRAVNEMLRQRYEERSVLRPGCGRSLRCLRRWCFWPLRRRQTRPPLPADAVPEECYADVLMVVEARVGDSAFETLPMARRRYRHQE